MPDTEHSAAELVVQPDDAPIQFFDLKAQPSQVLLCWHSVSQVTGARAYQLAQFWSPALQLIYP